MTDYVLLPGAPKWPSHTLTWSIATQNYGNETYFGSPAPFTAFWKPADYAYARAVIMTGLGPWADTCNLVFKEVPDGPDVDIRLGFAKQLSGAWCVYRQTNGVMDQALVQFGESWIPHINTTPESLYNMSKQCCHELGHAIGFDHTGVAPSIMQASNSGLVLGSVDIAGARDLYGTAQPTSISDGISAITGCQNDTINLITPDDHFVFSGAGQDQIATSLGHDYITAGEGYDYVNSGGGNDTILGGGGFDQLNAGAGYDSVSGGPDSDMIAGNEGNDTIDGGGGADWMSGGEGGDTFILRKGEAANDTIADFQTGVDHLVLIGYDNDPLINNGNGTWSIGGEMFIAGPINEATDVTRS
jgi:hypothetical protein